MTCSIKSAKKSSQSGKHTKSVRSVELEGDSVLYKIGADRITLTMDELVTQLGQYGLGVSCNLPVHIPKIRIKQKKIYHDISCNCYDCRAGVSLRARD